MDILLISRLLLLLKVLSVKATDFSQINSDYGSYSPTFEQRLIQENLEDGYWIEAFKVNPQSPIGLVAYGLVNGEVNLYQNVSTTTGAIEPIRIQDFRTPVGMDQADITHNGFNDIIICFDYGNTIRDFDPDGGRIVWLENPGPNLGQAPWKRHYVGKSATMHRLKVGHFTQTQRWEIIGLPVVSGLFDVAVPVWLFTEPDNVLNATEWIPLLINEQYFHLIHDAIRYNDSELDKLLIASSEGVTRLYFNQTLNNWTIENIGQGEQGEKQQTGYYGSSCIDAGRVGNDSMAYIATTEPFHGDVLAVYTKSMNNTLGQIQWNRYILDLYGHPDENGEGPSHYIVCADFDKDGDEEFLLALRGPPPTQGVYYYKPIDISRGLFAKWKVSDGSTARITVFDFDNDGLLDFATISYDVPGYYISDNPSINIFYNRLSQQNPLIKKELNVTTQNNTLLFTVSRPNETSQYEALSFLAIGGINVSLEIVPPHSSLKVFNNTYIKVLYGAIMWTDSSTTPQQPVNHSRTFLCQPKTVCPLEIHGDNDRITTGSEGALLLVQKTPYDINSVPQFDNIQKVTLENLLPDYSPQDALQLDFQFVQCDQHTCGSQVTGLELYNLQGFDIKFADNGEQLCYMQLWAAGLGVNTGVQNYATDVSCEVRACIISGSGKGGMYYLNSSQQSYDPNTTPDSAFQKLVVPSFYEQGPLWDIDAQGKPVLRNDGTVVYPWQKWQAGTNASLSQSFDIWIAFEYNSNLSTIPTISTTSTIPTISTTSTIPTISTTSMMSTTSTLPVTVNKATQPFTLNIFNTFMIILLAYTHYSTPVL